MIYPKKSKGLTGLEKRDKQSDLWLCCCLSFNLIFKQKKNHEHRNRS